MKVSISERPTFPFSEDQTIHRQEGWGDLIFLSAAEIGRLPKPQQAAIEGL